MIRPPLLRVLPVRTPIDRERAYLRGLVTKFENAVRLHEMRGGGDPDDMPAKEVYYEQCKRKLFEAIGLQR